MNVIIMNSALIKVGNVAFSYILFVGLGFWIEKSVPGLGTLIVMILMLDFFESTNESFFIFLNAA